MKKTKTIVWAFVALVLAGCQVPLLTTSTSAVTNGKASLTFAVQSNGFSFVPVNTNGRFAIPAAPTPGVASYVLHDPTSKHPDIMGASAETIADIPPGVWNLTVTLKDIDGIRVLGSGSAANLDLKSGPNSVNVTVLPNQTGTGRIDVNYNWSQSGIDSGSFGLWRLTLTGTGPYTITKTAVPTPGAVTLDFSAKTAHFLFDVPSGSYQLVLNLKSGVDPHPPITATTDVYDGVTSQATVPVSSAMLSGPPVPVAVSSISVNYNGYPQVSWAMPTTTATNFLIYRDGVLIKTQAPGSNTAYEDSAYTPGTTHTYSIVAANGFGQSAETFWPTPFVGITSVSLTPNGALRMGIGDLVSFTTAFAPSNATSKTVSLYNDNGYAATLTPGGQLSILGLGTVNVTATSGESNPVIAATAIPYSVAANISAESKVSTFASLASSYLNAATMGPDGNLYVVGAGTVHRYDSMGTSTNMGGQSYGGAAGIAVDSALNIYVADNHAIYKSTVVANAITVTTVLAGSAGAAGNLDATGTAARFDGIRGLVYNPSDTLLYVADTLNNRIRTVNTSTGLTANYAGDGTQAEMDGPQINSQFNYPSGLAFDVDHNLYVADFNGGSIRKVSGGTVTTITNGLASPWGLAVDGNDLYVGEFLSSIKRIRLGEPTQPPVQSITIAGTGAFGGAAVDGLGGDAVFNQGRAVAVASGGVVYVADQLNHSVRRVITSVFGDIPSNDTRFGSLSYPWMSTLYVGDGYTGAMRVGTIFLYTTTDGNHGKLMITGLDPNYNSNPGKWRVHFDWVTWNSGDTLVAQGKDAVVDDTGGLYYFDLDTGTAVSNSTTGDIYIFGGDFAPAAVGTSFGIYQ